MMESIGSLAPLQPDGRVLYPGEPELICREERLANGIPVGLGVIEELNRCARQHKEEPLAADEPNSK